MNDITSEAGCQTFTLKQIDQVDHDLDHLVQVDQIDNDLDNLVPHLRQVVQIYHLDHLVPDR